MAFPSALVPGRCYFWPGFCDASLTVPEIQTLVYVEPFVDGDGKPCWLFKEPLQDETGADFVSVTESQLHEILDLPGLCRWLDAETRAAAPYPQPGRIAEPTDAIFSELVANVRTFLDDVRWMSLTISARFGDGGLSVSRLEPGPVRLNSYLANRFVENLEANERRVMENAGVESLSHHDLNDGRSRVLHFRAPASAHEIAAVVQRLLIEVHGLRAEDRLDYRYLTAGGQTTTR